MLRRASSRGSLECRVVSTHFPAHPYHILCTAQARGHLDHTPLGNEPSLCCLLSLLTHSWTWLRTCLDFKTQCSEKNDKFNIEKSQIAACTKDLTFKATLKSVHYPTGNHVTDKDPWKVSTLNGRKDPLCNQESWLHIKHQIVLRHNGTFCCCCYDTHGVTAHGPATRQKSSEDNCNLSF